MDDGSLRIQDRESLALSPRELQLIKYAASGLTDTAIAQRLGISESTVGTYWGRVRIKIGPYNRTELVAIFLRRQQEEALDTLRKENAQLLGDIQKSAIHSSGQATLYQELIENAPDAIILVSESGFVTNGNLAAHELFGYDAGEMNDLPLVNLIPERLRAAHQEHRQQYVHDPRRRAMGEHLHTPARRKDGTEFLVRAALSALPTPAGLIITCVLRLAEPGP